MNFCQHDGGFEKHCFSFSHCIKEDAIALNTEAYPGVFFLGDTQEKTTSTIYFLRCTVLYPRRTFTSKSDVYI